MDQFADDDPQFLRSCGVYILLHLSRIIYIKALFPFPPVLVEDFIISDYIRFFLGKNLTYFSFIL